MPAAAAFSDSNVATTLNDVPFLISARSANAVISEDRPTRIQAETLLVLNALLDELLLIILASAKSLATDRIKTDGMLRVLNNNLLAKDAVLEAEVELRSFVEGKRAEGAKVPLGLMATSRLDGTDGFPVQAAYKALRKRCEYYSTLGDSNDDTAARDQNLMSSDGRPIATVTPGAAIYVTALLEFVGVHILQNVSRVIERDNSDEASLYDLRAAITEDEQFNPLFSKMSIKHELARRIDVLESRHRKIIDDGAPRGFRSDARVVKPWHVPTEGDFDEAAGSALFSSKRASLQQPQRSTHDGTSSISSSSRQGHAPSSSISHSDSLHGSTSTLRTSASVVNTSDAPNGTISPDSGSASKRNGALASVGLGNPRPSNTGGTTRRQSSDRSWSGVFSGIKRRNSFKQGTDAAPVPARLVLPSDSNSTNVSQAESALDPDDDFEAIMLSGKTMKVSLTPNRLHTIEVAKKGAAEANTSSVRRRPGTPSMRPEATFPATPFGRGHSPTSTQNSPTAVGGDTVSGTATGAGAGERSSTSIASLSEAGVAPPGLRSSLQTAMRPERRAAAPPPSSYRSPSPLLAGNNKQNVLARDLVEEDAAPAPAPPTSSSFRRAAPRLQPRNDEVRRNASSAKDLVDLFKSTPPSASHERFGSIASDTSSFTEGGPKKSVMGDRVRTLFGRKSSSSNGHSAPSSPRQKPLPLHQRADTKASLEGSQDTYNTSSATNSMDHTRSLVSPHEVPFNRNAASRSSTSTSEHPTFSADAAMEAKPAEARSAPDVAVVEPGHAPNKAIIGLGVGMAAAAGAGAGAGAGATETMAAAPSPSYGSRSTSYASQTPSTVEGAGQDGLVADDASTTSKSRPGPDELVSRKVPWGYKRNSTSASMAIERSATPSSDRRRSVGYQSSNGHGVLPVRGQAGAPSSEAGHGFVAAGGAASASPVADASDEGGATTTWAPPTSATTTSASANTLSRGNKAPTAWAGQSAGWPTQTLVRRGSLGSRPVSANQVRRAGASLETIQTLADLERAMRSCHSVDECRALVRKAMHSDGAPLLASEARANGVTDEKAAVDDGKADAASGNTVGSNARDGIAQDVASTRSAAPATAAAAAAAAAVPMLATAPADLRSDQVSRMKGSIDDRGLEPDDKVAAAEPSPVDGTTSLAKVEDGLIVAWLLGGDDDPASTRRVDLKDDPTSERQQREGNADANVTNGELDAPSVSRWTGKAGAAEQQKSLDSIVSGGSVGMLDSSSVVSLQSNYKDASEDVAVE